VQKNILKCAKSRMALFKFWSDFACLSSDSMYRGYGECQFAFLSANLNLSVPNSRMALFSLCKILVV
jgi:hypothetical protein